MSVGKNRKRPPRAAHLGPERRRPQILDAALSLAATRGLHAVHMESVAQAMGVTKPVIYACFGSRDDLLNALLEREEQRLFTGVMAALPRQLDLHDPQRLMREGFHALFTVVNAHTDSWRLVLATESDPTVGERHRQARQMVSLRVSGLVEAWLRLRGARDIGRQRPVLVTIFMSICEGMVRSLIERPSDWDSEALADYVGRLVLAAMTAASAPNPMKPGVE